MSDGESRMYIRRIASADEHWLLGVVRRRRRYEVRAADRSARSLSLNELDSLLEARRYPADFWAVVHAVDAAFLAGDRHTWFDARTGAAAPLPD